jgi:PAS domain S-box-containing protein
MNPMQKQESNDDIELKSRLAEAERALLESEQRSKAISETYPIAVGISEPDGSFKYINRAYEQVFGFTLEEINQINANDLYVDPKDRQKWLKVIRKQGSLRDREVRLKRKDGTSFWALISVAPIMDGGKRAFVGSVVDISELRHSYDEIRQLNCTLTALSNSNQAMLHASNEQEFLSNVCRIIIDDCGFAMTWIGYAEDDQQKSVRPIASAGFEKGYLEALNITWAETERGMGPTGTAIRTMKPARCNNMLTDPKFAPWREAALKRGYASSIVLPLISGKRAFGALNIYAKEPDGFSDAEEKLLVELASDLSFGIVTLRLRHSNARAVEALRLSEERYRGLFDNMTEGFALHEIICDAHGIPCDYRFLEINQSFERLTGLKRDQTIGKLATEVLPGLESFWIDTYGKVALTGQPIQLDNYTETLGRYYRVYAYRPAPGQVAVIFSDITEIKHTEDRLEYLASFPENNPRPVVEADTDGKVTYANPTALKLFPDMFTAQVNHPWLRDWESVNQFFRQGQTTMMVRDLAVGNQIYQQYLNYIAQQGLIRIYGFDVTAQKKAEEALRLSEEKYRNIVETAAEGIVLAQLDGSYTYVNQQMANMLGYTVEEMLGKSGLDLMYGDQQNQIQGLRNELHQGEILRSEFKFRCKDGSALWSMYTASPIFNDKGEHIANLAMHTDITQRKLVEEALRHAHDELELRVEERTQELQNALKKELEVHDQLVQSEKFAAVGRLLASITHEINNPLQTIKNCLYLCQMDIPAGTPASDALNIASTETTRLSNLVAQLRELYRPPAHGLHRPLDLTALVSEVQVLLASYLQDKQVSWEVTPPESPHFSQLKVTGVPEQLKQVFLNICLNAIDAMEQHGGRIMVDFKISEVDDHVGVRFCDTGPGLPPEVKEKLFEPFITTKEKGLGLGLVICYDIIQKHNGHIEVESEPGQGTAFTVWLPANQE